MSGWCLASINIYILTFPFRRMSCLPFKTKYATLTSPKATRHSMKAFFLNATKHRQQNSQKTLWFQFQLFVLGKSYAKPGNKVIVTSGELERWKLVASPGFKLLVFLEAFMVMAIMILLIIMKAADAITRRRGFQRRSLWWKSCGQLSDWLAQVGEMTSLYAKHVKYCAKSCFNI